MSVGENSPCFEFIHQFLGEHCVGVEIGIADGGNAEAVLAYIQPEMYYMVDPWAPYPGYESFTQEYHERDYQATLNRIGSHSAAHVMRMTSEEASRIVPNNLDFVYVDGNHAYDFKMLDMECWYPKIRSGGVLCGDDYNIEDTQRVVRDFCEKYHLTFEVSTFTHPHALEFWIIKP